MWCFVFSVIRCVSLGVGWCQGDGKTAMWSGRSYPMATLPQSIPRRKAILTTACVERQRMEHLFDLEEMDVA